MLVGQDGLEPFLHQLLAGPGNRVDAGIQSVAIWPSLHPSPASDASAFNSMRAFASWRAPRLPARINVLSRSRSSSLSFTTYFFAAVCFAVTTHLRHYGAIDSEINRNIKDVGY